jgi:hypothetical protein
MGLGGWAWYVWARCGELVRGCGMEEDRIGDVHEKVG